jgi:hypothetical protein
MNAKQLAKKTGYTTAHLSHLRKVTPSWPEPQGKKRDRKTGRPCLQWDWPEVRAVLIEQGRWDEKRNKPIVLKRKWTPLPETVEWAKGRGFDV